MDMVDMVVDKDLVDMDMVDIDMGDMDMVDKYGLVKFTCPPQPFCGPS